MEEGSHCSSCEEWNLKGPALLLQRHWESPRTQDLANYFSGMGVETRLDDPPAQFLGFQVQRDQSPLVMYPDRNINFT